MITRIEIIERAIEMVYRRLERIEEMERRGEITPERADYAYEQAFEDLSELQIELEEQIRRDEQDRLDNLPPIQIDIDEW